MPLSKDILTRTLASPEGEAAYRIVERLQDAGFEARFVGGAVRDMLLGQIPHDIDIATVAHPDQIQTVFPDARMEAPELGAVRIVTKQGGTFEVTTYREEHPLSDGRTPSSVTFSDRESDAKRRDFTVNAMYVDPIARDIDDPFDGQADLQERLVRFIGIPEERIRHDALRIIRAVRLHALLNGQYHPETYAALKTLAALTGHLSGARILQEWEKILLGPHVDIALEDLRELGVMAAVLPELDVLRGIPQPKDYHREGDVWEHVLRLTRAFRDDDSVDVRIAAVFHDCGKAQTFSLKERIRFDHHAEVSADLTAGALKRLQCPRARIDNIEWIIRHHMMMGSFADMPETRKAHWYFHPWFPDLLRVMRLDIDGTDPSDYSLLDSIRQDYNRFLDSHPRPPRKLLSGEQVMETLGVPPGERVGQVLHALHEAQISGSVSTKSEAIAFVKTYGKP